MDDPALERLKHAQALELEMIKATAAFEHAALRPPFLLNGGALVVYLALYGVLISRGSGFALDQALARWAMGLWIAGLVAAAIATAAGFRSQFSFRKHRGQQVKEIEARDKDELDDAGKYEALSKCFAKIGNRSRVVAVVCAAGSLVLFITGVFCAFYSLP